MWSNRVSSIHPLMSLKMIFIQSLSYYFLACILQFHLIFSRKMSVSYRLSSLLTYHLNWNKDTFQSHRWRKLSLKWKFFREKWIPCSSSEWILFKRVCSLRICCIKVTTCLFYSFVVCVMYMQTPSNALIVAHSSLCMAMVVDAYYTLKIFS